MTDTKAKIKPKHMEAAERTTSAMIPTGWGGQGEARHCRECKAIMPMNADRQTKHERTCPVTKIAQAFANSERHTLQQAADAAKKIARECDRPGMDYACNNPSATAAYECEKAILALLET